MVKTPVSKTGSPGSNPGACAKRKRPSHYRLDGKTLVAMPPDILAWSIEDVMAESRSIGTRVAYDNVGGVVISTVFIGVDVGHDGPPLVFETMTFPDGAVRRWSTWEEAEEGHAEIVKERMNPGAPRQCEGE